MTKKRILGCLRVPPVEYHCSKYPLCKMLHIVVLYACLACLILVQCVINYVITVCYNNF
jgi:hypothetical protein